MREIQDTRYIEMTHDVAATTFDKTIADSYRASVGEVPWGQPFQGVLEIFNA